MAWGVGQLLFGWLGWKSGVMPNWLAILGFVGGVSSVLASLNVPPLGPLLFLVAVVIFGVWSLVTGLVLLRK